MTTRPRASCSTARTPPGGRSSPRCCRSTRSKAQLNAVWNVSIHDPNAHAPIGSGPFLLTEYLQGTQIGLTRNPNWWGSSPSLDKLEFPFIPSTAAQVQALLAGELTAIHPQVDASLASLQGAPGIVFESGPDRFEEHLDFNTASSAMPLLGQSWFRQAVAYALDRDGSIAHAWEPLSLSVSPLDSLVHLGQQQEYKPVFGRYAYDPGRVTSIMRRHGCVAGPDQSGRATAPARRSASRRRAGTHSGSWCRNS